MINEYDDDKWHPVSDISTTTSKPYILEGSAKTLGGFIGKSRSTTDDSVSKLLVKDPYELKKETVFTDRIDQFLPQYPSEIVEEPYEAAHQYHRHPVYQPVFRQDFEAHKS